MLEAGNEMVILVVAIIILVSCLYVVTGMWLGRHGGVHRWQLWLMDVVFGVVVVGAIFMTIEPFNLRIVGLGAGLGIFAGAIWALIDKKIPPSARPHRQRQDTTQHRE